MIGSILYHMITWGALILFFIIFFILVPIRIIESIADGNFILAFFMIWIDLRLIYEVFLSKKSRAAWVKWYKK